MSEIPHGETGARNSVFYGVDIEKLISAKNTGFSQTIRAAFNGQSILVFMHSDKFTKIKVIHALLVNLSLNLWT